MAANFQPKPVTFTTWNGTYPTTPYQKAEPLFLVGSLPAATTTTVGGITKQPTIAAFANGTDTNTQINLNTILAALKSAGIIS